MGLQNWQWWRWLAASVVVGVAIGFALTRLDPDDPSLPSTSFTAMRAKLERLTETGESIVTRIRVGPVTPDVSGKPVQSVTFWERQRNRTTGKWDPTLAYRTVTPVPLSPKSPTPTFGVLDYLAAKKADIPTLDYRFQWYLVPRNVWLMSVGGSVLLIGVLWPLTLKVMVRLGLAEPPTERAPELGVVRHEETSAPAGGSRVTADDQQKLADLNAELQANVAGMSVTAAAAPAADSPLVAAGPVKLPTERPATPVLAGTNDDKRPDDFKGEFYPVARPVLKKDDQDSSV